MNGLEEVDAWLCSQGLTQQLDRMRIVKRNLAFLAHAVDDGTLDRAMEESSGEHRRELMWSLAESAEFVDSLYNLWRWRLWTKQNTSNWRSLGGFRTKLRARRYAGYYIAPADSEAGCERGAGRRRRDHTPPFDPNSTFGTRVKRIAGSALRRYRINAEPRLPFAFGESLLLPAGLVFARRRNRQSRAITALGESTQTGISASRRKCRWPA